MKKSEQIIIDHCEGLMEAMTNYTPVCNENSKFIMVSIGKGDDAIKISYDKQTAAEGVDMDQIQMSAYVQCLGFVLQYFTQGRLVEIVGRWDDAAAEEGPDA